MYSSSSCEPVPLVSLLYVKVHNSILTIRLSVQILVRVHLRHSLSLSNFFDSDKECLNTILEQIFRLCLCRTFLLDGRMKKNIICPKIKEFVSAIVFILHQKGIPWRDIQKFRRLFLQCTYKLIFKVEKGSRFINYELLQAGKTIIFSSTSQCIVHF